MLMCWSWDLRLVSQSIQLQGRQARTWWYLPAAAAVGRFFKICDTSLGHQGHIHISSQSNKKSGRNLWPSEIFSVVRDSPYWNIFKSKKIIVWEKKFRSLHPREQKKLVGVFTFFNGALEKKLEWCDQKNRIRSADGSIWQNANKKNMCTLECTNAQLFQFLIVNKDF